MFSALTQKHTKTHKNHAKTTQAQKHKNTKTHEHTKTQNTHKTHKKQNTQKHTTHNQRRFVPSDLLCPATLTWHPYAQVKPLLDQFGFCSNVSSSMFL
jgi:hypothetical protein